MAEYRLEDLARISGVSARNIRAYRERGLLDSPRRVGRSAYYGERHLDQLTAISQLLAKGFNSVHIAEFFAALRAGKDLSGALGIQASDWCRPAALPLNVDPADGDVRTLVESGLVRIVDGSVVVTDPALVALVGGAEDHRRLVRAMAQVCRVTGAEVDHLAASAAVAVAEGEGGPSAAERSELVRVVVSARVDRALRDGVVATGPAGGRRPRLAR